MVIVKIFLDHSKYFEIGSPKEIDMKEELPLVRTYQLYKFHIFSKNGRGEYKPLDKNTYFIYKDSDGNRYLYLQHPSDKPGPYRIRNISEFKLYGDLPIKIFMNRTNDYYIYNVYTNVFKVREVNDDYICKFILSKVKLSKKELLYKIFRKKQIQIMKHYLQECHQIINIDFQVDIIPKNTIFKRFKDFILQYQIYSFLY